jgi:hypothetical protein
LTAIFVELVKDFGETDEAKKIAFETAIRHFRDTAEQIKKVTDMAHLQKLKKQMLEQWKELEKLTGGDKEKLEKIREWGRKFNEEKRIFYDLIGEVKDQVNDLSTEIQQKLAGLMGNTSVIEGYMRGDRAAVIATIKNGISYELKSQKSLGLSTILNAIKDPETGFSTELDMSGSTAFTGELLKLASAVKAEGRKMANSEADNKRCEEAIVAVSEDVDAIIKAITKISKTYKLVKKIHDTQFLDVFNE